MLGYMSAAEAKKEGFTHSGSYWGIPLWINVDKDFTVATKWEPMEYVMTLCHVIDGLFQSIFFPNDAPGFVFKLKEPL